MIGERTDKKNTHTDTHLQTSIPWHVSVFVNTKKGRHPEYFFFIIKTGLGNQTSHVSKCKKLDWEARTARGRKQ